MALKTNYIESEYSQTWSEDGVVFQIISPKVKKITLEIAKQLVEDRNYAKGNFNFDVPVFVQVNNATSVDSEASNYYKTKEPFKGIKCIAMLVDNYASRLVGNLIFTVKKPFVPTSLFTSQKKAMEWLKNFRNLN